MDEFTVISEIFRPLTEGRAEALGLCDDAAALPGGLAVTTDTLNQGVHFLGTESPADLAHKLLAVNLSDLAAMGATPYCYLLNLSLPRAIGENWLRSFARALRAMQERFGLFLAGGDTTNALSHISLALTAFGRMDGRAMLRRSTAKSGDVVYVSGTIGDAALGLDLLQSRMAPALPDEARRFLEARYLRPEPRVALGRALCGVASAAMDVSDGLAQDFARVCAASGCGGMIESARVPLSEAAHRWLARQPQALARILGGGDDYELLFTTPPPHAAEIAAIAARLGVLLTAIGHVAPGAGVRILGANGEEIALDAPGYRHLF